MPRHPQAAETAVMLDDGQQLTTIRNLQDANKFIERLRSEPEPVMDDERLERLHTLLLAQTPRAARAQQQMDRHKHGYHHREKRLYELIDFNDTFVALVLATPQAMLPGLATRLQSDMAHFCRRLRTAMFSQEQYEAIVRGLSREIAVFWAARAQGFEVRMTSRTEDAFGIDMIVYDPQTDKTLNIDCKTPSAFRYRLEDLLQEGRITEEQLLAADEQDFITTDQHRGANIVPVTLLCIRPETLGDITDFTFNEPAKLTQLLDHILVTIDV